MNDQQEPDDNFGPKPAGAAEYMSRVVSMGRASRLDSLAELTYGPDPAQRLDVYAPAGGICVGRSLPVLVFFHGGSWVRGDRSWLRVR